LLHKSPTSVILSTLAVSYIVLHATGQVWGSIPYALDFPFSGVAEVGGVRISMERGMLLLSATVAVVALYLLLNKTMAGKRMRATAQDVIGARLIGIDTNRVHDYTIIVAASMAALSGIAIATVWSASTFIGQRMLIKGFVIVIIGGLGNIWGVIAVGLAVGISEALFGAFVTPYYREAFIYGIMVVILLLKPHGLFAERK
jgi:branched-chain amino acid transport system permease protein